MKSFVCHCGKSFTASHSLRRHERTVHGDPSAATKCPKCPRTFSRKDALAIHLKTHDSDHICPVCGKVEKSQAALQHHMQDYIQPFDEISQPSTSAGPSDPNVYTEKALRGGLRNYRYNLEEGESDFEGAQRTYKDRLLKLLNGMISKSPIKWYYASKVRFCKVDDPDDTTEQYFRSRTIAAMQDYVLGDQLDDAFIQTQQHCSAFTKRGSGWIVESVLTVELNIAKYKPLTGSSYVALPYHIKAKKAVLNIQNKDHYCFVYSVLAALHPVDRLENANRVSNYTPFKEELNLHGLTFPLPLHQVSKFEKQNDISVNVLGYEKKEFFPLHVSKLKVERQVDLLLISQDNTQHYCLINSMSRLLGDVTQHKAASFYCRYCLHRFSSERTLTNHKTLCEGHEQQTVHLPDEDNKWLKFNKIQRQMKVPFSIYADFECVLSPIDTCLPDPATSTTTTTNHHVPCGYCIAVVDQDSKLRGTPIVYRGEETVGHFVQNILELEGELSQILDTEVPLTMTPADEIKFASATHCHICSKPLNGDSVRDHDHLTGKFRAAAHSGCNLEYKVPTHIPVIFHNLRGYDSHLIMEGIGKAKDKKLQCIPNNMQKYISFSVGNLRFIDSIQFMASSLDSLVNNLAKTGLDQFNILKQQFPAHQLPLLTRKGVFPYEYCTSLEKFDEKVLPPKQAFYSSLSLQDISDKDYAHAQNIWKTFDMKTLGDYHDLYVLTDTLLLADVFQNFRTICMNTYNLDPCHYFTAPGLAWDACLKHTGVKLELLTDIDQYLFVEDGIRGGISMISTRYAKSNNKYLPNHDPSKPSSYIAYYDANNLYGYAMSLPLPVDGFRWMSEEEISHLDIENIPTEGDTGYILSVDLEYPQELHDLHNDYPLAPNE